jgi:pimeloyl-ACP methyl ester carboxylesterase
LHEVVQQVSPQKPVTLVLHDWGCVFGYEYAATYPERVSRMVAVDVGDHNSRALNASLSAKAKWAVFSYQIWLALAWQIANLSGGFWQTFGQHNDALHGQGFKVPQPAG